MEGPAMATEKSAQELQREIDELYRRQREITERLRDPRGIRKGSGFGINARNGGPGGMRNLGKQRGTIRRPEEIAPEEQPPVKKRISSAVVKVNEDHPDKADADADKQLEEEEDRDNQHEMEEGEINGSRPRSRVPFLARRDSKKGIKEADTTLVEPAPRVLTKENDPSLVKRNRRMFGALLGTLQKFVTEDEQLSTSEAFTRRSETLKRAEQRAQEESERLRQQERELFTEKRRRDISLRARLAAKAEEKQLELLFIQWTQHHSKLSKNLRTKTEPHIYYMPAKLTDELEKELEHQQREFLEWKNKRREELTKYQKEVTEKHLSNAEAEIERWLNRRNAANSTMDSVPKEDEESNEGSRGGNKVAQEEEEEADEDFMADDDMDGNPLVGEDTKDPDSEKEIKGVVEYCSGDDDVTAAS